MQTETFTPPPKDHRIAARLTREHKSLFERAATLKGLTLTDFMVSAAYEAALKVLSESQVLLTLGPEDSRLFFESMLHPRKHSELPALQEAIQAATPTPPTESPTIGWGAQLVQDIQSGVLDTSAWVAMPIEDSVQWVKDLRQREAMERANRE